MTTTIQCECGRSIQEGRHAPCDPACAAGKGMVRTALQCSDAQIAEEKFIRRQREIRERIRQTMRDAAARLGSLEAAAKEILGSPARSTAIRVARNYPDDREFCVIVACHREEIGSQA